MTDNKTTKSGMEKRLVRRLQKASGVKYTTALRALEDMNSKEDREAFVKAAEMHVSTGMRTFMTKIDTGEMA